MFKKDIGAGGRKKPAGRKFASAREEKTLYKAKCSECGNPCQVPFKPNGKKPVLCSHCYGKADSSHFENPGARRINESGKETFPAVCDSCGKTCGVPFRPNGKKPVLCSLCFSKGAEGGNRYERKDRKEKNDRLDVINEKLDRIIKTLASLQ